MKPKLLPIVIASLCCYWLLFYAVAKTQTTFMFNSGTGKSYMTYDAEEYHAESDYVRQILRKQVAAKTPLGRKLAVLITLPANPWGDKPLFIFSSGIIRLLCRVTGIGNENHSLYYLNFLSIVCILAMNYLIIGKIYGRMHAAVSCIFIYFTFDMFYVALAGYHTLFGLTIFLAGFSLSLSSDSRRRRFLTGLAFGLSLFASPHCLPLVLVMMVKELLFRSLCRHMISGFALVFAYFIGCDLFNPLPHLSTIQSLLTQSHSAAHYSWQLPRQPLFLPRYLMDSEGWSFFAAIILGLLAATRYWRQGISHGRFLLWLLAFATPLFWIITAAPMVSRVFSPAIVLMSSIAGAEIMTLFTVDGEKRTRLWIGILIGLIILFGRINNFFDQYERFGNRWTSTTPASFTGYTVIHDPELAQLTGMRETGEDSTVIAITIAGKFRHHDFADTGTLLTLAGLQDRGLQPAATSRCRFLANDCYHNEYFAYWLYFGNGGSIVSKYPFLRYFDIGLTYYFYLPALREIGEITPAHN